MTKHPGIKFSLLTDRLIVLFAYLFSIFVAWLSILFFPEQEIWIKIAIGDFVATVLVFLFSMLFKNSSMYDAYWSVAPIVILFYLLVVNEFPFGRIRSILAASLVLYWGIRLTFNWLRGWQGLNHQDWRYTKMAGDTGLFYWPVSFLGIHLFPTILVYLACLTLIPVLSSETDLIWTDLFGFFISFLAIEIERRSDNQLRAFKSDKNALKGAVCDIGLWKYSRHPNYFGEILFWFGLFVMAYGINPAENLIYGIGFIAMVLLFVFISIPMMEKRQLHKEGYNEYREKVSMIVPWFRNIKNFGNRVMKE